jgi:hypothetical protein
MNRHAEAVADLNEAIERGTSKPGAPATGTVPTRVFFLRAQSREATGDAAGARRDREEGLRRTPADEIS